MQCEKCKSTHLDVTSQVDKIFEEWVTHEPYWGTCLQLTCCKCGHQFEEIV